MLKRSTARRSRSLQSDHVAQMPIAEGGRMIRQSGEGVRYGTGRALVVVLAVVGLLGFIATVAWMLAS
jgi:hypothetical protein